MAKFKTRYELEDEKKSYGWKAGEHNQVLVERTGYVPLSVRLKQFTVAGLQMSLQAKQFDFEDYKEVYHSLDVISPDDDLETTQEKLNNYYNELAIVQSKLQKGNQHANVNKEHEQAVESDVVKTEPEKSEVM